MGAAMAYSACETIRKHMIDTGRDEKYYDLILTGDLGIYGTKILKECYKKKYKNTLILPVLVQVLTFFLIAPYSTGYLNCFSDTRL